MGLPIHISSPDLFLNFRFIYLANYWSSPFGYQINISNLPCSEFIFLPHNSFCSCIPLCSQECQLHPAKCSDLHISLWILISLPSYIGSISKSCRLSLETSPDYGCFLWAPLLSLWSTIPFFHLDYHSGLLLTCLLHSVALPKIYS